MDHSGTQSAAAIAKGKIVSEEAKETGRVSAAVWRRYVAALGKAGIALTCASLFFGNLSLIAADLWVGTVWATQAGSHSVAFYRGTFLAIVAGGILMMIFTTVRVNLLSVGAAARIFDQMLANVFYLPLRFFESVPSGRIINRFSSDTDKIDQLLPHNLESVLKQYGYGFVILSSGRARGVCRNSASPR